MKEINTEQRLLLALVLSVIVITLSDLFVFRRLPGAPAPGQRPPGQVEPPARPTSPAMPAPATPAAQPGAQAPSPAAPAVAAANEQAVVVDSSVYRVVLSNRGAVVRSWQLKRYHDDSSPPRVLDVVHPPANASSEEWPLSLLLVDPKLQSDANTALFQVQSSGVALRAPAEVDFSWSDGHLAVTKQLDFGRDYLVRLRSSVTLDGRPLAYAVAWRGGFGDPTAENAAAQVSMFYASAGKIELLAGKKLGSSNQPDLPAEVRGPIQFAGIEDHYFAAAFLPLDESLSAWDWRTERQVTVDGKPTPEDVAEVAVGAPETAPGPVALQLYVGPKALGELGSVNPELRQLVHYGWLGIIAAPLFDFLQFIHRYVPNYGWAIVVLTIVLNMALFPFRMSQWRSMQKMQRVMPELKAIQNRYKKYPMRDPRRQKMNEEMMELYRREGVNPMGSCLPMVFQMPIWIGLYEMLGVAIELRHARWIGWIHDLSAHDPYYIIPALMVVAGYAQQKMTPATTVDPNQQKMLNYMPVLMGLFFFRLSSGLNLYILTSYVVGVAQQYYLNKTAPAPIPAGRAKRQATE
ncbi:MAG TPA: membrane protein insertase YidC [Candidatus Acidoferrales bacterium]|nr:membrane protein insertase YidC [Candidatus Acidoferrales bacterium]